MIIDIVVRGHAFPLTTDDTATISRVYEAFFKGGPALDYGVDVTTGSGRPTYEALMAATDQQGHNWSFLANESRYQTVRRMAQRNLIVLLTGDFAGTTALRRVGRYLNDRHLIVDVFYLSNVEYYLFRQGDWMSFYENVAALPLNSSRTFIRTVNAKDFIGTTAMGFASVSASMRHTIDSFHQGQIARYLDIVQMSSR